MNTNILICPRGASRRAPAGLRASGIVLAAALSLLAAADLRAGAPNNVIVGSVCGGGPTTNVNVFYGSREGNPANSINAQFHTPMGLALETSGRYLFVADRDNSKIRVVDLLSSSTHYNLTYPFAPIPGYTSGTVTNPVGVALDSDDNVYVLNRANNTNGHVVVFDYDFAEPFATNDLPLKFANAIAVDSAGNAYVTASNNLYRITFPSGITTPVVTNLAGANLQGVVVMQNGMIAACDSSRQGIYFINPANGIVTTNTGFNGVGDNNNIWTNTPNFPVGRTNALFNQPMGLAKAGNNMLVVADYGNNRVKVVDASGTVTNLYGVTSNLWLPKPPGLWPGWRDGNVTVPDAVGDVEGRLPTGVLVAPDAKVYVTEDYYHLIRFATSTTLPPPPPWPPGAPAILTVLTNCGQVSLTWSVSVLATNYNIKRSNSSGGPYAALTNTAATTYIDTSVLNGTTYYYVISAVGAGGEGPNSAQVSVVPGPPDAPTIMTVVTNYGLVSLTWSTVVCPGVTYNVRRSPSHGGPYTLLANIPSTSYNDTGVLNGSTNYYVVSAVTTGGEGPYSPERFAIVPLPPVPDPKIGYVDFPANSTPIPYTAVFHQVSSYVANNDVAIVIQGTNGSQTFYTYGATGSSILDPTNSSPSAPVGYQDGMFPSQVAAYTIGQIMPDLTLKAIGEKADGSPNSAIVVSRFQFVTANPVITGLNFYNFTLGELTTNAVLFYTLDGTDPSYTNGFDLSTTATLTGTVWTVQMTTTIQSNTLFKVRAFHDNYQPSAIVSSFFLAANAIANRITPNSGYYPMGRTITVMSPNNSVYYTGDGTEPTTASIPVIITNNTGYIRWFNPTNDLRGLRVKAFAAGGVTAEVTGQPVTTNTIGVPAGFNPAIYGGIGAQIVVPVVVNLKSNVTIRSYQFRVEISPSGGAQPIAGFDALNVGTNDLVPVSSIAPGGTTGFFTVQPYTWGSTNGLEVYAVGNTNNVNFQNFAVVALLRIAIPFTASAGDSYALQVSWVSATSDGLSDVVPLTLMAPTTVLVTNVAYKVGDSAFMSGGWSLSGGWYNAGGFGNGDLDNSDVNLAFDASMGWHTPFIFSDVFNAMDAYPVDEAGFVGGDGMIRFLDWNVVLQRSLRMDTNNWARAWSAGGNLVEVPTTLTPAKALEQKSEPKSAPAWPWYRQALLGAVPMDNAVPGGRVIVPVYLKLSDGAALSGLQFRAAVTPQGGAPALTQPLQFAPAAGVAGPTLQQSFKANDAGFGWALGSFNYLSRSSNFLGWLTFTVPVTAHSGQAYSVSFPNADGAPNLSTQYDLETRSACVAVGGSAAPASICSDEWKLRFFGSLTNPNAGDLADPDGDGVPNWREYVAGTDPADWTSRLKLNGPARQAGQGQSTLLLQWLTAPGKAYELQWSSNLAVGSWSTLATASGDGNVLSCSDTNLNAKARYYRLRVLP